jgi:hypothetical protein
VLKKEKMPLCRVLEADQKAAAVRCGAVLRKLQSTRRNCWERGRFSWKQGREDGDERFRCLAACGS